MDTFVHEMISGKGRAGAWLDTIREKYQSAKIGYKMMHMQAKKGKTESQRKFYENIL